MALSTNLRDIGRGNSNSDSDVPYMVITRWNDYVKNDLPDRVGHFDISTFELNLSLHLQIYSVDIIMLLGYSYTYG